MRGHHRRIGRRAQESVAGPQSHDSPARLPGKGSPRTGNAPGAAAGGVFSFAGWNRGFPRVTPFPLRSALAAAVGLRASESPFGRRARGSSAFYARGFGRGWRTGAFARAFVRAHEREGDDRARERDPGGDEQRRSKPSMKASTGGRLRPARP